MEKRTDKIKKVTFGGFFSEFLRWNPKGKGSKEKDAMILDLKNCITHQLVRIKKLKYIISVLKEDRDNRKTVEEVRNIRSEYKKKLVNQKNKVGVRDKNLEQQEQQLSEMELNLKNNEKVIARLLREVSKKEEFIADLKKTKKVVTKIVEKPLSKEVLKIEKLTETPFDERGINVLDFSLKFSRFCNDRKISPTLLGILSQIERSKSLKFSELLVGSRINLNTLLSGGYINFQLAKQVKHYFLTAKGEQIVEDLKNYLSYSKLLK